MSSSQGYQAGTDLLGAALESMPYGFSVWSENLHLILWNDRYPAIYSMPHERLRVGMTLAEICELTVAVGNHPGTTAEELLALYTPRHAPHADPASPPQRYEKKIRGRIVRTTYLPRRGFGCVVIHDDITEDVKRMRYLEEREAQLELQNIRFTAVIENLNQGICLFNSAGRLVICNSQFAEMYGLPREMVQAGTAIEDILRHRVENGRHPVGNKEKYFERRLSLARNHEPNFDVVELADGRVIAITHQPTPDGGWVSTHRDITEQRRNEERIHHIARHDSLTGLPNRLHFREIMATAVDRIANGEQLALLAIDLDRFKQVNDSLGHGAGDAVLQTTAKRLRECCRDNDIVGRIGGDEFVILAGNLQSRSDAAALAARIVDSMTRPMDVAGRQVALGASVGIAFAPVDGTDDKQLVHNADLALYRAKGERRSSYRFFERGIDTAVQRRHEMETGLRSALSKNELRLVFQPIFNLAERRIVCFEALLRWDRAEYGTVAPADFIPIAEETGLIVSIGRWALDEACRVASRWPDNVNVAVNLSTAQFHDQSLVSEIRASLERHGLLPGRLNLEVTESLLLQDAETALTTLRELHAMGIRISLDDFGTGFSSLSYLRSFPFDTIKIDKSFVQTIGESDGNRTIVTAVIDLGRSLGISTTAEGVETELQLELLTRQGCCEVQGFLFAPPLPAAATAGLLGNRGAARKWHRLLERSASAAGYSGA